MNKNFMLLILCAFSTQTIFASLATADETAAPDGEASAAELAKELANPLAAMISIPFQMNYDQDFGVDDTGDRFLMNVQPVVPFSVAKDWNLISRTITPVITQNELAAGSGRQTGLGDTVESLWFSPKKPTDKGLVWGAGAAILIPTATDDLLGGGKWGLGPSIVGLRQIGPWTYGGLANHVWSVAGSDDRNDISSTYVQPFIAYNTPSAVTYILNSESSYDWESEQWAVPINFMVSKLTRFGGQMVSFQGGVRYWAKSTDSGPEGVGLRFSVTLLLPK